MCGGRRLALRDLVGRSFGGSLTPVGGLRNGILEGVVEPGEIKETLRNLDSFPNPSR